MWQDGQEEENAGAEGLAPEEEGGFEPPPREKPSREELRERILGLFQERLDHALTAQDLTGFPPELIEEEAEGGEEAGGDGRTGLLALWSAMTALTQEVKTQGRAFQALRESLAGLSALEPKIEGVLENHQESLQTALRMGQRAKGLREDCTRMILEQAREEGRRENLKILLDLRDRLKRLLATIPKETPAPPAVGPLLRAEPVAPASSPKSQDGISRAALGRVGPCEIFSGGQGRPSHPLLGQSVPKSMAPGNLFGWWRRGWEWIAGNGKIPPVPPSLPASSNGYEAKSRPKPILAQPSGAPTFLGDTSMGGEAGKEDEDRPGGEPSRKSPTAEIMSGMAEGLRMAFERLDEALREMGILEIRAEGERFDPERMRAVAVEESDAVSEGTVVEVYRPGYRLDGGILRPAEVKVARAKKKKAENADVHG